MTLRLVRSAKSAKSSKSASVPPRRRANLEARSREFLTVDEVHRLARGAASHGRNTHRDRLLVMTIYRHGLRVSEAADLRWDDVMFGRTCSVQVRRVKNGVAAVHPLSGEEIRDLKRLRRESPESPFVFCSERGGPMTNRTVHHIVARAGELAGFAFPVHPHQLRHARGFRLAGKGVDTRAIQAYLGHRRIESTTIYTALDPGRFKGFEED